MNQIASTVPTIETDTWVKASWETLSALADDPAYENGRLYYDRGNLRIEMAALGSAHGQDNTVLSNVVAIFAALKNLRTKGLTNASFWKTGVRGCQPDLAFYIGTEFGQLPRNNSPVNVDEFGAPSLVIEIGASSFQDDLGNKRLLYEQLGIQEYWVVNVETSEVFAFKVNQGSSGRIHESLVLPRLKISLVEEALQRSQVEDDGTINRWLLQTFTDLS